MLVEIKHPAAGRLLCATRSNESLVSFIRTNLVSFFCCRRAIDSHHLPYPRTDGEETGASLYDFVAGCDVVFGAVHVERHLVACLSTWLQLHRKPPPSRPRTISKSPSLATVALVGSSPNAHANCNGSGIDVAERTPRLLQRSTTSASK